MATTRVQLPDGNIGEFPASMKPEEIEAVLQKQFPPESAAPGVPKAPTPAGLQGPPVRHSLMSGNAPIQQMFDEAATAPKPTSAKNVMADLGAGATRLFSPLAHPLQAVAGMAKLGKAAFDPMAATDLAQDAVRPFMTNPGGEAIAAIPQAAMMLAGGGEATAAKPTQLSTFRNLGERIGGYESPVIPTEIQQASRVAKAIRPVGGIGPNFEQNIASNIPAIKAYAQEIGNPLHSQWEAGAAAKSLAEKNLANYKENFLRPVENQQISMQSVPEYQGPVSGEGRYTTLGSIEKRLSDINDQIRAAERTAKTTGMQMSANEKLGLEAERGKLADILYREISKSSGVEPEAIKGMRQRYGQQFEIADTIDAARRARLGPLGAAAEGTGTFPTSKIGLLEKAATALRGGQEFLANRNFRRAIEPFPAQAQEMLSPRMAEVLTPSSRSPLWNGIQNEKPPVQTMTPDVEGANQVMGNKMQQRAAQRAETESKATTNRMAANQEALKAHELETAAQEAAAQRAKIASDERIERIRDRWNTRGRRLQ